MDQFEDFRQEYQQFMKNWKWPKGHYLSKENEHRQYKKVNRFVKKAIKKDFIFEKVRMLLRGQLMAERGGKAHRGRMIEQKLFKFLDTLPAKKKQEYLKRGPTGVNKLDAMRRDAGVWRGRKIYKPWR